MKGTSVSRYSLAVVASVVAFLLSPAEGLASGGESIASAPQLNLGVVESGGGRMLDFWRVRLFAGDTMTFDVDLSPKNGDVAFDLFDPSVTDYTFDQARNVANYERLNGGKHQFTLQSPFTGLGTLVVCR